MKDNPFTSDIFTNIWSKHFDHAAQGIRFSFIKNLLFLKHKYLPIYFNYGKTHTKGISYSLNKHNISDIRKKTFLIYDVPTYFNVVTEIENKNLRFNRIKQYPGYLIELQSFEDVNHYMQTTFSKSSRYKLKKYKKRLELCFDIKYKMYSGDISKDSYDHIFDHFKTLLEKRFAEKQIRNNNLDPAEWNFYYDVSYPMILAKKAGLFVIYDGDKPIGVTLNYLSGEILFDAITVFDTDYAKFHLGTVTIMKQIEWCLLNDIQILDFSKGHFEYKERWATKKYLFEYHIYFDRNSLLSHIIAFSLKLFLNLKQELRKRHVNEMIHKLTFQLKNRKQPLKVGYTYSLIDDNTPITSPQLKQIDHFSKDFEFLKSAIFDFLYLNQENHQMLHVYQVINEPNTYILKGQGHQVKALGE